MAMNNFGAGFVLRGKDLASKVVKKFSSTLTNLKSVFKSVGLSMASIGAAAAKMGSMIVGALGNASQANRLFSVGVAEVSTLIDSADMSTKQIRDTTLGMSKAFGTSAAIQTKALYQTISSGITDATEATKLLNTANRLAVGGITDVETGVDGLTNVMNAYAGAQLEATDVSDAFFVTIKAGKTTAAELASNIGRVAPVAEGAGVAFDDLLATIGAITTKGINTSETVSGLSAALGNVAKPAKDAQDEAKRLGIEFSKNAIRTKGWKGFLDSITKSAGFNADSMDKLFGSIEAGKVMTALTANEGEKLNEVLGLMKNRTGETDKAFEKISETYDHQVKKMNALKEAISITFGKSVERILSPFVRAINVVSSGFSNLLDALPPGLRDMIVSVAGGIGGIATAVGAFVGLFGVMNILGITVSGLIGSFVAFMGILAPMVLLVAGLGVGFVAASKAMRKEAGKNQSTWEMVSEKIKLAYKGIVQIFQKGELSEAFKKQLEDANQGGVIKFLKGFQGLVEKAKKFWDGLMIGFEIGVAQLGPNIQRLKDEFGGMFDMFGDDASMETWMDSGIDAGESLASLGGTVIDIFTEVVKVAKEMSASFGEVTSEDITAGIQDTVAAFNGMLEAFEAIDMVLKPIFRGLKGVYNLIQLISAAIGEGLGFIFSGFNTDAGFKATSEQFDDMINAFTGEETMGGDKGKGQSKRKSKASLSDARVKQLRSLASDLNSESDLLTTSIAKEKSAHKREKLDAELKDTLSKLEAVVSRLAKNGVKANVAFESVADAANAHAENEAGRYVAPELALGT